MKASETTIAATSASQVFINLPVADLRRSVDFFTALGFTFDPMFTDDTSTCMNVGPNIYAMLLTRDKFQGFTPKPVADAVQTSEVLVCLSFESRAKVDELVRRALGAGGRVVREPQDHGFMYEHGFEDPDGHIWELIHADLSKLEER